MALTPSSVAALRRSTAARSDEVGAFREKLRHMKEKCVCTSTFELGILKSVSVYHKNHCDGSLDSHMTVTRTNWLEEQ